MGFQLMQILDLLGVSFDAVVVEVKKNFLLFRLPMAIGHIVCWRKQSWKTGQERMSDSKEINTCSSSKEWYFSNFSCRFLNPNNFSQFEF